MSRRRRWRRRMRSTGCACSSSTSVLPTASHSARLSTRLGVVGRAFLLLRRTLLGRGRRGRRGARGSSPSPLLVCGHGAVCKGSALALLFWCAVFSSVDDRPMMLDIMAGMDQEDTYMLVDFSLRPLVSGSLLFAVLLGLTVDTCYVSLQRLLWEIAEHFRFQYNAWFDIHLGDDFFEFLVLSALLGSTVALRDDFVEMVVFSTMLGSASVYGCFWKNLVFLRDGEPGEVASPCLVRTWKSEHYFNKQLL